MRHTWILLFALLNIGVAQCRKGQGKWKEEEPNDPLSLHDEARLYKNLTESYDIWNPDRALRPIHNTSETVNVHFGLALINFLQFDETSNIATFNTWEHYLWNDAFLKWDPSDYGGIDQIRLPIDCIWQPDIQPYEGFDPSDGKIRDSLTVVSSDGNVLYIPVVARRNVCNKKSGVVSCEMKFGSWTYDGFKLDINFYDDLEDVDISDYSENTQFKLKSHSAKKVVKIYPCCKEPYPNLGFSLEFEEKSSWWGKK